MPNNDWRTQCADHKLPLNWPDDLSLLFEDKWNEAKSQMRGSGPPWVVQCRKKCLEKNKHKFTLYWLHSITALYIIFKLTESLYLKLISTLWLIQKRPIPLWIRIFSLRLPLIHMWTFSAGLTHSTNEKNTIECCIKTSRMNLLIQGLCVCSTV